jgi:hypothetical protein
MQWQVFAVVSFISVLSLLKPTTLLLVMSFYLAHHLFDAKICNLFR